MMTFRSAATAAFAAIAAAALVSACTTTGDTGYVKGSRGGGWENFRAEAPIGKPERSWIA